MKPFRRGPGSFSRRNLSICEPFKGRDAAAVLATPGMIMVMENALNAIKPYLDPARVRSARRRSPPRSTVGQRVKGEARSRTSMAGASSSDPGD
jgi:hypothetical protein